MSLFKTKLIAASVAAALSPLSYATVINSTYHNDFRQSIKLDLSPTFNAKTSLTGEQLAHSFLAQNKNKYLAETSLNNLKLSKVKPSLSATHYHFQQYLNDIEIDKAEIIVSISNKGEVVRVFNNTYPTPVQVMVDKQSLTAEKATNVAWNYLQVSGKLQASPKTTLTYLNLGRQFKLAYKVSMIVSQPQGDWEFYIDALNGKVIQSYRIDLPISKNANALENGAKWQPFAKNKNHYPLTNALANFKAASQKADIVASKADATGLVFDPDPRTALNNESLADTSPATDFDAAYVTRTLKDVTLNGGVYSLVGPWVSIVDWDAPNTAPSTSTTGNWTAKRGNNAFNDAMTYFHIDQNQRYMQSLGFTGATGIQFAPIVVDTDGADGADNSFYQPGANQLSFGHGCVDDNEDADVILHEYGHAINHSINSNFSGGDSGAMGEGFGDYWAASYSYSTANGLSFHPEWAFSWDGHNACWGGRRLDKTNDRYDPSQSYGAHAVVNGVLGDELWSTPLAQSLIDLMNLGVPRGEVDQILLESQFGLGSGLTMPDMAASIVATANRLFPGGQHGNVFNTHFKTMNILSNPLEAQELAVITAGSNTIADPGETVSFNVPLKNKGGSTVTQIASTLSTSTGGITIGSASSAYPDINASATANNMTPFELSIPANHTCGNDIALSLAVNYNDGSADNSTLDLVLPVGAGTQSTQSSSPSASIPDNNATGITEQIVVSGVAANSTVSVDINITHTWRGDLTLTLTSPAGTTVTLQSPSGDSSDDIIGNYPGDLTPEQSLSAFDGEDHNGTWSLKVVDSGAQDLGTLNSWGIVSTSPASCNGSGNVAPVAAVANATITQMEGTTIALDATPSSDADDATNTLSYAWTQTSGPTVTINNNNSAQASFVSPQVTQTTAMTFEVTVTDPQGASDTATVNVTVNDSNNAPVAAVANANISVDEGAGVTLDASPSSDPDGDTLSYSWTQTSGTSVAINNATSASASFTAPQVNANTSLSFQVTVTDSEGSSDTTSVSVSVNNTTPIDNGGSSGGGGSLGWFSLVLLSALFRRNKIAK